MAMACLPVVVAWLLGHVPGISQGHVVVDAAGEDVRVEVDVVFARIDAARLAEPLLTVSAGSSPCHHGPVVAEDVEGDGRALRVEARCPDDGDIIVDLAGLATLPPTHRLALRAIDDAGLRDTVLSPDGTVLVLPRPHGTTPPSAGVIALGLAVLAVAGGARRPRALAGTAAWAAIGGGVTLLLRPLIGPAPDAVVVEVVQFVVAALAVLGVALDPSPRARPSAFALGAALLGR
jgi:hypothetical protein